MFFKQKTETIDFKTFLAGNFCLLKDIVVYCSLFVASSSKGTVKLNLTY
ncbi:hypothetical protein [Bacillus sp. V2I10]|nr:hypothetical protein [Bacillus sp. V2I10]MDQ0859977.1 hypothetical protein [Bacillus sp. V2I10]